jgi:hypothetical protein
MIGQTVVHILVDNFLKNLAIEQKLNLAETLQGLEKTDPGWLKRLIAEHMARVKHFWRLFPRILTYRFERLAKLRGLKRLVHLPAATAGFLVTMIACWQAWRFLKRGSTDYWPDTKSPNLVKLKIPETSHRTTLAGSIK